MAHILLIDDDEQFRLMLKQMLSGDGHRVSEASDGTDGLQAAAASRPDLVITDILMPKKDGIEVIVDINRNDPSLPIIAISGGRRTISAEFNLDSARMMGVRATLAKPFSRDQLRAAIRKVLPST